jgi:hypothetical protein
MGPFYTMAKYCDHESARALETHQKVIPREIRNKFVWSCTLKCSREEVYEPMEWIPALS